jgi:hypothetical protein
MHQDDEERRNRVYPTARLFKSAGDFNEEKNKTLVVKPDSDSHSSSGEFDIKLMIPCLSFNLRYRVLSLELFLVVSLN